MEVLEEDVKTPKHKKRGKDRHKVPVLLTTEQKVTVASSEADEVQKEIKETKKNSEKLIDTLRVRLTCVWCGVCVCVGGLFDCFVSGERRECHIGVMYACCIHSHACVRACVFVEWAGEGQFAALCSAVR